LVIAGPSGTGKSHFTEGLAQAAIEKDLRVAWFTLETLSAAISKSKVDGSTARTVARICRADLIVVDDIGLLPVGEDAAEAFYRIIDAAYERRSIAVTSNIHPSGFDMIMPKTLAGASTDRLMHHAHLVTTTGDSHRLAEALAGKADPPALTPTQEHYWPQAWISDGHHPGRPATTHLGISMTVDTRLVDHVEGQLPLLDMAHLGRDGARPTSGHLGRLGLRRGGIPALGQEQTPVHRRRGAVGRQMQRNPGLTVGDLARGAGVLPRHTRGCVPVLEEPGVVNDQRGRADHILHPPGQPGPHMRGLPRAGGDEVGQSLPVAVLAQPAAIGSTDLRPPSCSSPRR
jgi:hypothetical protein